MTPLKEDPEEMGHETFVEKTPDLGIPVYPDDLLSAIEANTATIAELQETADQYAAAFRKSEEMRKGAHYWVDRPEGGWTEETLPVEGSLVAWESEELTYSGRFEFREGFWHVSYAQGQSQKHIYRRPDVTCWMYLKKAGLSLEDK